MARKSMIGVSDEVVKDQILEVFSPVLSDCEVYVECFAGNVMVMVSGSKDDFSYTVDFDVRDLVFAWEGDYFGKFLDEKLSELQVRIEKKTRLVAINRIEEDINEGIFLMDLKLNRRIAKLHHLLNDQLIDLQYGRGYRDEFMDNLLLEVEKL